MLRAEVLDLTVKLALREDVGRRDVTTSAVIPSGKHIRAEIEAHEDGVLCGIEAAEMVFRRVDENIRFLPVAKDGEGVQPEREIAYIEGSAASILIAERTALNFLGRLSGIATLTRQFVEKIKGTPAKIYDTRKTTPNLRLLEKQAVAAGGGVNHRQGLYDEMLIKDNHLRVLKDISIPAIVASARKAGLKNTVIGLEVKNLKELAAALKTPLNYILLDNFKPEEVREAVAMRKKESVKMDFEASGGIHLENVREYAEAGVERISIGALTHSARWLDIALEIVG